MIMPWSDVVKSAKIEGCCKRIEVALFATWRMRRIWRVLRNWCWPAELIIWTRNRRCSRQRWPNGRCSSRRGFYRRRSDNALDQRPLPNPGRDRRRRSARPAQSRYRRPIARGLPRGGRDRSAQMQLRQPRGVNHRATISLAGPVFAHGLIMPLRQKKHSGRDEAWRNGIAPFSRQWDGCCGC